MNVSLSGEIKGDYFAVRTDDGDFLIRPEDLGAMGLKAPDGRIVEFKGERFLSLKSVQGLSFVFDDKTISLSITAPPALFHKTVIDMNPPRRYHVYYPRENSAFLNYGITYSHADPEFQTFTLSNKLGARSGDFLFLTDSLYTKTDSTDKFVRLMSNVTYERRDDLQWLVLGDMFASSGDLGSTINIGGIGFSKLYKIDPNFLKQPTLNLTGVVSFPSQAEIYMDGALISRQKIQPGEFELANLYNYGGARMVEVILKDPFGNEQRIAYPVYFTDILLKKGLHEYSYNIGFLREQYGIESSEYGKAAFSAFHRYGIGDSLNIGARAEASEGIYNGGAHVSFAVPRAGVFSLAFAESAANEQTGAAGALLHTYQRGNFITNFILRGYSRDYVNLGTPPTALKIKYEGNAGVSYSASIWGTFSLGYSAVERYDGGTGRITSATYSRKLTNTTSLLVSARAISDIGTDYEFFIGINYYPDKNPKASAQYQQRKDADTETVQIYKNTPIGEGLGYRVALARAHTDIDTAYSVNPFLQYNARYGTYTLDSTLRDVKGEVTKTYALSAAGSLVYAGGFSGISRPVNDSFGFVTTGALPDVGVSLNNEEIGKTDSSGTMIIPTVKSYYHNQIAIDAKEILSDYRMSGVNTNISPSLWSGSCVSFDVSRMLAVTGRLYVKKETKQEYLELFEITMKAEGKDIKFQTGMGGEFYLENMLPDSAESGPADERSCRAIAGRKATGRNVIRPGSYPSSADYEGKKCGFLIHFPATEDVMADLGDIECVVTQASEPVPSAQETATLLPEKPAPLPEETLTFVVQFFPKTSTPSRMDRLTFSQILWYLRTQPALQIELEGHADRKGPDEVNKKLGIKRALAVQKYLTNAGVKKELFKGLVSYGKTKMICSKPTEECDTVNRRVVIRLVPPGQGENSETGGESLIFTVQPLSKKGIPTSDSKKVLSRVLWYLRGDPELQVVVEGHGELTGTEKNNIKLGMARALALKNYLVKSGISAARMKNIVSYGKEQPICTKPRKECDQINRRVVIRVVKENEPEDETEEVDDGTP